MFYITKAIKLPEVIRNENDVFYLSKLPRMVILLQKNLFLQKNIF